MYTAEVKQAIGPILDQFGTSINSQSLAHNDDASILKQKKIIKPINGAFELTEAGMSFLADLQKEVQSLG